ncbi:MAG: ATP-binding cassette domain-containing protein [Planctomycetota bacterium]
MLKIDRLSMDYHGGICALDSVDLEIGTGMFGLLGPNGAGKSTLMRILATLQTPTSGGATLDGIELADSPMRARPVIGYLPQDVGAYPRVTAWELLDYLAGLRGIGPAHERKRRVREQLGRVNLIDAADRRVDTYSGGMLQRLGIATIFLAEPRLVIVDEPTAGLDPTERRRFQCLLAEAAGDCVLLLSSHIVEDVAGLCERMAIMDQGRVVASGDPAELVRSLAGKVGVKRVGFDELDHWKRKIRLISWRPERGRLLLRARDERLEDHGFERAEPDLEDFYSLSLKQEASAAVGAGVR